MRRCFQLSTTHKTRDMYSDLSQRYAPSTTPLHPGWFVLDDRRRSGVRGQTLSCRIIPVVLGVGHGQILSCVLGPSRDQVCPKTQDHLYPPGPTFVLGQIKFVFALWDNFFCPSYQELPR